MEMIDGLDLDEKAVLRLKKVVDSSIDRTDRISELRGRFVKTSYPKSIRKPNG